MLRILLYLQKMVINTKNTKNKKLTRSQRRLVEAEYASDGVNAMGEHIEPPSENMDVGNASKPTASTNMQIAENPETAVEMDRAIEDVEAKQVSKKMIRGLTKGTKETINKRLTRSQRRLAESEYGSDGFNAMGEHIEPPSENMDVGNAGKPTASSNTQIAENPETAVEVDGAIKDVEAKQVSKKRIRGPTEVTKKTKNKKLARSQRRLVESEYASDGFNAMREHIEPPSENMNVGNACKATASTNMQIAENTETAVEVDRSIEDVEAKSKKRIRGPTKVTKKTINKKLTRSQRRLVESEYASDGFNATGEHIEPTSENMDVGNASKPTASTNMQIAENPEIAVEVDRAIKDVEAKQVSKKRIRGPTKVTKKTKNKKLARFQRRLVESEHACDGFNVMGEHIEPPSENMDVGNACKATASTNMQIAENPETAVEVDRSIEDVEAKQVSEKRIRGLTKVKRFPLDVASRIEIEFNSSGIPVGEGSVKLSSYLGSLVREYVPFTLDDWRLLGDDLKLVLWKSVQARFKVHEEWQKIPIFQQMGCIWRSSKSIFVKKVLQAKTKEEQLQLKPENIRSMKEWKKFIESKTSKEFKLRSEKFKSMRDMQMPHTCSRRGMARLTEDLKVESINPSSICRSDVWIKSHTRKNGEPVNMHVADAIEKIKNVENVSQSSLTYKFKEDALSLVLGQDRPGRLRGMGRGVTMTSAVLSQIKDNGVTQCQHRIPELEQLVHMLMKRQDKESCGEGNVSQMSKHNQIDDNCSLLHWHGNDDEVVAKGKIMSTDPKDLFNGVPLGPNAMKILVIHPTKSDVFLWRPSPDLVYIGDAKNEIVAWPANRVIRIRENSEKENESKTDSTEKKCKLFDWVGSKELVAEGRVHSSDSKQIINGIPLGPGAAIVWVDNPRKEDAFLWRPVVGTTCIGEAVGKKIAWPTSKLVFEDITPSNPVSNVPASLTSANFMVNTECKLFDVEGMGKIVAEGIISSIDPKDKVHSIPLGPNAIRVWVDIVKVPNARLWRPTSFMECLSDAIGSTVAWPTANVRADSTSIK